MNTVSINFNKLDLERFDDALSDFMCWMGGFKAGGGKYSPGTEDSIRALRIVLNRALDLAEEAP